MQHYGNLHGSFVRACVVGALSLGAIPATGEAQESKTLVVGRAMDFNSLDPSRSFCDTCQIYLSSVYDTLVALGADNQSLQPGLAESWTVNDAQTEFEFTIRDGAKFADGTSVEASDVVWTFQRMKNLKGSPSFLMDGMISIEARDPRTVRISLESSNSEFLNKLSAPYAGIMNAEVAAAGGAIADETAAEQDQAENWFLSNSAGSGPFKLVSYSPEAELRLARNDEYWGEKPYFAEVVISQIQNAVGQAQALESGAIDVAMQVDADTAASIRSDDVTVEIVPSYNFLYIAFAPGAKGMADVLTPEVREALTLAINYDEMLEFTVGGNGAKQAAPIPNGFPGTANLPLREQNVEKAKQMLADAGVNDGLSIMAGYPNDNVYGVDINIMMQKVQQDLKAINVDLELRPLTYAVWREELYGDGLPMTGLYFAPDYYGAGQYPAYFAMMPGTTWLARSGLEDQEALVNPAAADLYKQALASSGDEAEAIYEKIGLEMMKDNMIIPMVSPNLVLAYRNDIKGVRYSACCNLPLAELTRD
ncbi:ABC transporter substrate-binding protein [Sulfitobacter sp. 1A12057]|uniref:ABC transporter substrate-binding protein n=1 Tax=Sulfitobacter sp. 1A12057 TaxID=3368567 RepID=UPI003746C37B